jgi:hypothetical protein
MGSQASKSRKLTRLAEYEIKIAEKRQSASNRNID